MAPGFRPAGSGSGGRAISMRPLADVPDQAEIMQVEPFGPVAVPNRFTDLDDAPDRANRTPYALGAYAFTGSEETAETIARRLDAGLVGVNTFAVTLPDSPIGGRRCSGHGSEGGPEGLAACFMPKFTAMD